MYLFDSEENELLSGITFKAIILMGGSGTRLRKSHPKQFLPLGGKKVYQWALDTFLEIPFFKEIILVSHADYIEDVIRDLSRYDQKITPVIGGSTRRESSFIGLKACGPKTDFVLIHDAVRPFVSVDIILRNLREVVKTGACDTCIPSNDTIFLSDGVEIQEVPNREQMYQGQTPQSFRYDWIMEAHKKNKKMKDPSDDCQLAIASGRLVSLVSGKEENQKITSSWNWEIAQWYAEKNLNYAHR